MHRKNTFFRWTETHVVDGKPVRLLVRRTLSPLAIHWLIVAAALAVIVVLAR